MPSTHNYEKLAKKVAAYPGATEKLAAARADTLEEIRLYDLRQALSRSQTDLADALGITQSAVSQLERGEDMKVSTLRNYVDHLGGKLRLTAVFDDGPEPTEVPIELGTAS